MKVSALCPKVQLVVPCQASLICYFLPAVGVTPPRIGQSAAETAKVPPVITYEDCSNGD
jgi:hypothetical protein